MIDPALQTFERLFGPEFGHGKPFDLTPLNAALKALGSPEGNLGAPLIHVAGTNGKGSTIAFMRAIIEAAGLRVHAFTKPHLHRLNERFVVSGEIVSDRVLIDAAEAVHAAAPTLTQFDAHVATAMLLFDENDADVVIIETGMGGRDDSTNVVPWPALTIITPIGLDHQDALGETLSEIATHKAGILKKHSPAVIARQPPVALDVIEQRAAEIGARLFRQGVEWDAFESHGRLVVQTENQALDLPLPSLVGRHQVDNAGLACAALLSPWRHNFTDEQFAAGVTNTVWPARLQPLMRGALSEPIRAIGGEVWVDGGHNAHGAAALARALGDMKARRGGSAVAIVGLRARKDASAFITALAPSTERIIAVPLSETHIPPEELASLAREHGADAQPAPSLSAAMQIAAQLPAPRVLICGSFVLAAEALERESS
ncbi:MAG: bifunctional folylpolyglutamate synthase/dihydrofolate synthase [Hyphomonadaceae bacterium]|nr:bifunctional folylpolyglutamate synthase/dihydrofolate synthase [Hyphomonadaceae bacterium]